MTMDIVFFVSSRRGLGHLMRTQNIAREITRLRPESRILFVVRGQLAEPFMGPEFEWFAAPDKLQLSELDALVKSTRPKIAVFDTLPADEATLDRLRHVKSVYIMRECEATRQAAILESPFLRRIDLIICPHAQNDVQFEPPEQLSGELCFVGPIVRQPDPTVTDRLAAEYHVDRKKFVMATTVGGGGYQDDTRFMLNVAERVDTELQRRSFAFQHFVFSGPNSAAIGTAGGTLKLLPPEPDLVSFFPLCDLVVSLAGYNTVHELRTAKCPAFLIPRPRKYDDQFARARAISAEGLARVAQGGANAVAQQIVEMCESESVLATIRQKYERQRVLVGNRRAAQLICNMFD